MSDFGALRREGVDLVGRSLELELISGFLDRAGREGEALLLNGEPGVGKTAILDYAADSAVAAKARVVRAAGVEFEAEMSFTGLNLTLLSLLGQLGGLNTTHREALNVALGLGEGKMPGLMLISNATLTLFRQAAADRPLVVMLDDLHWVDRASAFVLGFAARRLSGSRVGFLAASRLGHESFFDRSGLPELTVQPLDDDAASKLVGDRFPDLAPAVRKRVLDQARGNPLALLEMPAALSAAQRAALQTLPPSMPLSRRLKALYASRIAELPPATQELLLLMALDGTGDVRVLRGGPDGSIGLQAITAAEKALLAYMDTDARRLVFRHPLIRTAVVDASSADARLRANAMLAKLWADQPERRAWHLAESTIEPDEQVAELVERAAERSMRRGDGIGAISRLTRAAELSPRRADRSRRLAKAAFIGADVTGDLQNATRLMADAHSADPEFKNTLQAAVTAALVLIKGAGDVDMAHRFLVAAIESTPDPSDAAYRQALETLALICAVGGRPEMWTPFHSAVARLGSDVPWTLSLIGKTRAEPAHAVAAALPEIERATAGLSDELDPTQIVRVAILASPVDRLGGCRQALWRVIQDGRAGGAVASAIQAMILLARDEFLTGAWDESRDLVDEAVRLCDSIGDEFFAWQARYQLATIAALRGDYDTARTLTDAMMQWAEPRRFRGVAEHSSHARALSALGKGDFEEAYRQAAAISQAALSSQVPMAAKAFIDVVESAIRTGRKAEATALVNAMVEQGLGTLSPRLALVVAGSAAMAASDDTADGRFKEALAIPGINDYPLELARVELAYGERLRRARALVKSRVHLGHALEIFMRLGARPWADRARNELRATGQTKPRGAHSAMDSLTPQERKIALLAASGLTNKQIGERMFLSPRTVGGHLHRLFPKLGVATRAALRDALSSLGADKNGSS
jgi:DNA-binding CsgD family transcriptional regulator/tetratricopeptide (TPR) repeat protein